MRVTRRVVGDAAGTEPGSPDRFVVAEQTLTPIAVGAQIEARRDAGDCYRGMKDRPRVVAPKPLKWTSARLSDGSDVAQLDRAMMLA